MSLVNDALKRAQREAAAREARAKGLPEPLASGPQPYRARRRRAPGAVGRIALAALVVAAGAATFYWLSRGEIEAPRQASVGEAPVKGATGEPEAPVASPLPAASATPAPTVAEEAAASEPRGEPDARASAPVRTATGDAPAAPSRESFSSAAAPTAAASSRPAAGTPASRVGDQPTPRTAAAATQTYIREVALEDGRTIRLGGIAYSETAPLAYLNGRLLGVGEFVEGCAVRRIERSRVLLGCAGGELAIALQ